MKYLSIVSPRSTQVRFVYATRTVATFSAIALAALATACNNDDDTSSVTGGTGAGTMASSTGTGEGAGTPKERVRRQNLVSDQPGAAHRDADLVNPWGIAFGPSSPDASVWIADNHSGVATIYDEKGNKSPLVVTIPAVAGEDMSAPTGQVYNETPHFKGDRFIFDGEDGTITGWQAGTKADIRVDRSKADSIYKGLAIMTTGTPRLYATDFHNGHVDVFDANYGMVANAGFDDRDIPAGFAPFNVAVIDDEVFVTYAKQDAKKEDDDKGVGNGFIDVFTPAGSLMRRLVTRGVLDSPWGMAKAPADFGAFANMLLVGNFGDGAIHAFDPRSGELRGEVTDEAGAALHVEGLWSLSFGPTTLTPLPKKAVMTAQRLFFTAGPGDESHGAFGVLDLMHK